MKLLKFICKSCNRRHSKQSGFCFYCGACDCIMEDEVGESKKNYFRNIQIPILLSSIEGDFSNILIKTKIDELDRVLGGGIIKGGVFLIAGAPGVGKSTFLLYLADSFVEKKILYIATEEAIEQIKFRSLRLKIKNLRNIFFVYETSIENICLIIGDVSPDFIFIDSLQNCSFNDSVMNGHISALREGTQYLVDFCKKNKFTLFMTAHVTKDGTLAGPKFLEHVVDVVLYFEGEEDTEIRLLRSTKNRFGSTNEVGFFKMTEDGISQCEDPQDLLTSTYVNNVGSCFTWLREGSRLFLIEIQVLINESRLINPIRIVNGIDQKQLVLCCAVIEKYLKIPLFKYDIFCKVIGNMKIKDSYGDIALSCAILSSFFEKELPQGSIFGGEIGLSGNVFLKRDDNIGALLNKYNIKIVATPKLKNQYSGDIIFKELKAIKDIIYFFKK
jgi:DNA repair protein RadA/Sms